eukprot:9351764-Pyramimonas_sp.AAC.1
MNRHRMCIKLTRSDRGSPGASREPPGNLLGAPGACPARLATSWTSLGPPEARGVPWRICNMWSSGPQAGPPLAQHLRAQSCEN